MSRDFSWKTIGEEKAFSTPIFDGYLADRTGPEGRKGRFVWLDSPDWVVIIPWLLVDGIPHFIMEEQWRHGPCRMTREFPAGLVDKGEEAAAAAGRELLEETGMLLSLYAVIDQSPLGSAASYGVTLPLDREYTASLMGFRKVQNNVLYANNSRGKFEAFFLDHAEYIALTISKLAQDLMLFTLPEFGYFSLPRELCTGSSIMPQKRNPDGLELARSRTSLIGSCSMRVKSIIRALPSGYNRDFQDTKEPFIEGFRTALELVMITDEMIQGLEVHPDNLIKACTPELYATDRVMEKVLSGGNFRDSYRNVGLNLDKVQSEDPVESLRKRTSTGTTGNLMIDKDREWLRELMERSNREMERLSGIYSSLLPSVTEAIL